MTRERIGFDRQPQARTVECVPCGNVSPIERAGDWPQIVVLPTWDRTENYDAIGRCPECEARIERQAINEPEPEALLF
jgi:hypothetical protein